MNNPSTSEQTGSKYMSNPLEMGVTASPSVTTAAQVSAAPVEVCHLLNQCLTNCVDLRLQCKQAQWNTGGANGDTIVPLFARMAAAIERYADRISARIIALGGVADGTLDTVAEHSGLTVYPRPITRDSQHVDAVTRALDVTVASLRSEVAVMDGSCDGQTNDLLEELALELDSHRARLQAHK